MVIISLIFTFYLVLREPRVQTLLVRMASDYLSKELKTEVRIKGFNLSLTRGLVIEGLSIKDRQHQEIVAAKKLSIIPGQFSYKKKKLNISKVYLEGGAVQLLTHKGDSSLSFQFIIDYLSSGKKETVPDTTKSKPWDLSVSAVQLVDTRFHLNDENSEPVTEGIDFANLDIRHINLLITDFRPDGDTLKARINYLSAIERSGMTVHNLSGKFSVSSRFLKAKDLKIRTGMSDLDLNMEFRYDSWEAYNDFLNKVNIRAEINPTVLNMVEIGNFAPELYDMQDVVRIAGNVKGTVANFRAKDLRIAYGNTTRFYGNISATGLPNVEETFVDMNIKTFSTTREDVQSFKLPAGGGTITLPEFLHNAGVFNLKGMFTGFYNDFVAQAHLGTGIGGITTDLTVRTKKGSKDISYDGQANADHLNIGDLLKRKELGFVTFRADLKGRGTDINDVDLTANLVIDSLYFNKYIYKNVDVKGALTDRKFNGSLFINDPNLSLRFNGLVDLSDTIPVFDFTAKIYRAQLFTLNLLKRDSLMDLTSSIKVNIHGSNLDNLQGIIRLDSTWYIEGDKVIPLQRMSLLTSQGQNHQKSYHLLSDFINADVSGDFSFSQIIPSVENFVNTYLESFSMTKQKTTGNLVTANQRLNFQVKIKNADPVTNVFAPFLKLSPNTLIEGEYNEDKQQVEIKGSSDFVNLFGMNLRHWYIDATGRTDNLSIRTGCLQYELKKSDETDTLTILLDSLNLVSNVREDSIHYNLSWLSSDSISRMGGYLSFTNSPVIHLKFTDFKVLVDKRYWTIAPENDAVFDTAYTSFSDMTFSSGNQFFRINGSISDDKTDTLYAEFRGVDVSHLDYFIGSPDINLDGILSGKLRLADITQSLTVLADLHIDNFTFNKEMLGDASFAVHYDAMKKKFDVHSSIIYTGNTGTTIPFVLEGSYSLAEKEPKLDFDLRLKNLNLKMISPFVSSFMSGVKGYASGEVHISGPPDKTVFKGKINLLRTEFRINYLNVPYSMADVVSIEDGYFGFDKITLYDSLGNKAYLNGKITHDHLRNVRLDMNIDFTNFSAFRNSFAQNNIFYGNASGTGNVKITGPLDDITIKVKAQNTAGTHVVIPISTTAEVGANEYIIFKKPADTTGKTLGPEEPESSTKLSLDMAIQANPSATLEVFFPDQLGNINARGTGNLSMSMTPYTDFALGGTYTIQKGTFLFQLKNLMRYTFTIKEGSSIYWTGDPADANISISAVYKSRVALEGLTSDPNQKSSRIPVETIVHLTGKLMNPDISVSIELPNVDEDLKSVVYTSIDTTNKTEMTQQMINILVFNQFKSTQGINTGTVDVGTTSLTVLSNMASSFTSKLSKNVNIGVNYSRSSANAGSEWDVSFSTQAFNEKLHIEGLFGMSSMNPSSTAQKASTIVGDIDIRYDVSRNKRWQIRGFNRTNTYDDLNVNNAPYTQGVGISYKRDFNRWTDIFKKDLKDQKEKAKGK